MLDTRFIIPGALGAVVPIAYALSRPAWATSWWAETLAIALTSGGVVSAVVLSLAAIRVGTARPRGTAATGRDFVPLPSWFGWAFLLASWVWLIGADFVLRVGGITNSPLPAISVIREGVVATLFAFALLFHVIGVLAVRSAASNTARLGQSGA